MKISIIIPIRIDNPARLNNLNHCLSFLIANFAGAEIIVVESDAKTKLENVRNNFTKVAFHLLNTKERFCKSETMNYGVNKATMPIIATWDADIIIHPKAIAEAYKLMTGQKFRVISPHNTMVMDIKGKLLEEFVKNFDFNLLPPLNSIRSNQNQNGVKIKPGLVGGIAMFEKEALLHAGGYNRNMISYGWQDVEVLKRMNKLGYYNYILGKFDMIHLNHSRGIDSKMNTFYDKNKKEFYKVINMNRKELNDYVRDTLYSNLIYSDSPLNDSSPGLMKFFNLIYLKCIFSRIKRKILLKKWIMFK